MENLKEQTIRGGVAKMLTQAVSFLLRMGSMVVLARLLDPKDFGLVSMVTAFTGVLSLFRDFGLSAASVRRSSVTEEQTSTLFWINVAVGGILTVITVALAPVVSRFYHEPRLFWVMSVVGIGFVLNGGGVQHSAFLQRRMRFTALAFIDIASLVISTGVAVAVAEGGYGYWALVAMTVSLPLIQTIALWLTARWVPGRPRRGVGIRSMMRFGGTLTLNGLVMYVATNIEKVLLGRFWGAEAIGIYGRAYTLSRIPTDNLNSVAGELAFAALSRLQDDPDRLKRYFLAGYSLVLALTLPITIAFGLFADDVIFVLLGPKWGEAAPIVRILAPTILVFAIVNPLGWLLGSLGMVERGLKMALVFAPFIILGCVVGLPFGPQGVATAYSAVMILWLVPFVAWAVQGTMISVWDVLSTVIRPLVCAVVAAGVAFGIQFICGPMLSPMFRLLLESAVLFVTFSGLLLFAAGQKSVYMEILHGLKRSLSAEAKSPASA